MVKVHQLVAAIATTITLSTSAYALNMGSISWKSSYGQPLNARIELSDAKNLKATDIKTSLASSNDFSKAGLDYSPDLSNLSFTTVVNPDGTGYINVTSAKPIKEPFINFLMDVNWPNGKLSKEYTILLDIPEAKATATAPKKAAPTNTKASIDTPTNQATGSSYKTKQGDTLWSIAQANYGKAVTAKASKAIFEKNPKAFINGNINALLNNTTLTLPTTQEVNAVTVAEANAFLGTPVQAVTTAAKASKANTKLEQELQNQLQNSEKELASVRSENQSLNTDLANIQSEIDRLEQISQDKDREITKATKAKELATKQVADNQETAQQENHAQPVKTEENTTPTTETTQPITTENPEQAPKTQAVEQPTIPVQTPVQEPQEDTSPSFISSLLDNNLMLLAGGGVLLVLCVAALILRRRKAADDGAQVLDLSNIAIDDEDTHDQTIPPTQDNQVVSPLSQLGEGMGILDKVDIYLAYNHYDEAKDLLTNALHEDPTNTDFRLKLMEIYADQGDTKNFETVEQELLLLDPLAQHKIDNLKGKYPVLFNDFSFSNAPFPTQETVEETPLFSGLDTEKKTNNDSEDTKVEDDEFSFTAPIIEPIKKVEPEPKPAENIVSTELLKNDITNFELEKVSLDHQTPSSPLFKTETEEDFPSDSPIATFAKHDELSEVNNDNIKFDLGFNDKKSSEQIDYLSQLDGDSLEDEVIEKDQVTTKLELVHAYIDMGDAEGAQDLIREIMQEGNESQKNEAQSLLNSLNESSTYKTNLSHENADDELFNSVDHSNTALTELELGFELPPEDEVSTKLELANAYIEMGDKQGAKDILDEVLNEGNEEQKQKAQDLLQSL